MARVQIRFINETAAYSGELADAPVEITASGWITAYYTDGAVVHYPPSSIVRIEKIQTKIEEVPESEDVHGTDLQGNPGS